MPAVAETKFGKILLTTVERYDTSMSLQRSNHMAEREANRVARETNTRIDMDMNVVEPEKPKVSLNNAIGR